VSWEWVRLYDLRVNNAVTSKRQLRERSVSGPWRVVEDQNGTRTARRIGVEEDSLPMRSLERSHFPLLLAALSREQNLPRREAGG